MRRGLRLWRLPRKVWIIHNTHPDTGAAHRNEDTDQHAHPGGEHAHAHADADGPADGDADEHASPADRYADSGGDEHAHADADDPADGDADEHASPADKYADSGGDEHAHAHTDSNDPADLDADWEADEHASPADKYADSGGDEHTHEDAHEDTHEDTHRDAHTHADLDEYAYGVQDSEADQDAQAYQGGVGRRHRPVSNDQASGRRAFGVVFKWLRPAFQPRARALSTWSAHREGGTWLRDRASEGPSSMED